MDFAIRYVTRSSRTGNSFGLAEVPDVENGAPRGIAELVENRRDGQRQLTSVVYPLAGAKVITKMAKKIIESGRKQGKKVASGIELADRHQVFIKSGGEEFVCGGVYRSLQLLMLLGIGDKHETGKHGLPYVSKKSHDHQMFRYWELRHLEQGLAMALPHLQTHYSKEAVRGLAGHYYSTP